METEQIEKLASECTRIAKKAWKEHFENTGYDSEVIGGRIAIGRIASTLLQFYLDNHHLIIFKQQE